MKRLVLVLALVAWPAAAAAPGSAERLAAAFADGVPPARSLAVSLRARTPNAVRLARTIEGLVVARLAARPGAARVEVFAGDAQAARRAGYAAWMDGELAVEGQGIVVVGRVVPTGRDLWADVAGHKKAGAIVAAPFARARVDAELRAWLDAGGAADGKVTAPRANPPLKRRFVFRMLRAPLDLGAPLVALTAGDIDGDGRAELIALTAHEVVVLDLERDGARTRHILPLDGVAPAPRPREPVGTVIVADVAGDTPTPEILARTSEHANPLVLGWKDGALARVAAVAPKGFPTCALRDAAGVLHVATATLQPGLNVFARAGFELTPPLPLVAPLPETMVVVGCGEGVLAALDKGGTLRLYREQKAWGSIPAVGTAFAIVDLDDDGQPEIVASAWRAPGDGDVITIWRMDQGAPKLVRRGNPLQGGVVGIAAGDFDGDGAVDVTAAARLPGSTRVDLWVLD